MNQLFGASGGEEESLDAFGDAEGDDSSFGDAGGDDKKPFDDTPFDAGVEADEDEDPEKIYTTTCWKDRYIT